MDMKRKMELLNEWKNRRPEMGLIAITCKSTGEMFVDISTDTQFAFNSHRFKLSANYHPNKRLIAPLQCRVCQKRFRYSIVFA